MMNIWTPYEEGRIAYENGDYAGLNPYGWEDRQAMEDWENGWREALEADVASDE